MGIHRPAKNSGRVAGVAGYDVVRIVLGLVLLTAAAMLLGPPDGRPVSNEPVEIVVPVSWYGKTPAADPKATALRSPGSNTPSTNTPSTNTEVPK